MGLLKSASSKKAALFLGGAFLVSGSLFAIACGTDNGNADDTPLPTPEAGGRDARGDGSVTEPTDGGGASDATSAVDCGEVPFLPNNAQGFYCPFKDRDAGDGGRLPSTCANTEECCSPNQVGGNFPPAFCATAKTGDNACSAQAATFNSNWSAGGSVWECGDKRNCNGANAVCCMTTRPDAGTNKVNVGATNNTDWPKSCGVQEAYQWGGTVCRQNACTAGTELPLCAQDADCPNGQKCSPFFVQVGNRYFGSCK